MAAIRHTAADRVEHPPQALHWPSGEAPPTEGSPPAPAPTPRWSWPELSIRQAVLAAIAAAVLLPSLGMLWVDAQIARSQIDPLIEQRRERVLAFTAVTVAEPLLHARTAELATIEAMLLRDPLVCGVELRPNGSNGATLPGPIGRCAATEGATWREQSVVAEGRLAGTLRLGFDNRVQAQLLSDRQAALTQLALVTALLGGLVLAWVLNWRLLRPIHRLKRQAGALARPSSRHAPAQDWQRHDELGQLGQHLNLAHERIEGLLAEVESRNIELRRMAMVDPLTGLPNRRLFRELFEHALQVARRSQHTMALLFIDLDRFKHINDTLGHPAGDELLRTIAQRLRSVVRGSDIVGRLSGDEFVALLPEVRGPESVAQTALRVIHAVETPVPLAGQAVVMQVSASVGVAMYPGDGQAFDELLAQADQAMYRAKAEGRGRYILSREAGRPEPRAPTEAGSSAELAQALARREFKLYFQPVIDTRNGRAVGVEALLRWQHPQQGLLPPARFIHRAEACGQAHALCQRALEGACEQLAVWKASGVLDGCMAVNLSTGEFRHEHLPKLVGQLLKAYQLEPGELALELSSHTVMADPEFAQARADELRALGAALVLEDVGSSMVSLVRLGQLHPAKLKIDASLVARLPGDNEAYATVNALVQLARSLGVAVAALGVENEAQRDVLAELGCHWQQGFLFAPPAPASDAPPWATPSDPRAVDQRRAWPPVSQPSSRARPH